MARRRSSKRSSGRWSSDPWGPYVSVAERAAQAAEMVADLRDQGKPVSPVVIAGRSIAATFWGKAWCSNLEGYQSLANRLPRGRSYVRHGAVVDLQIAPQRISALVNGSSLYEVSIRIDPLPAEAWQALCADCSGSIDSLVELLQGKFSKTVMDRFCRQDGGLFPKPKEIHFDCSCPDGAIMCKHVSAVLYGVGARLDAHPALLFRLRGVDETDLIGQVSAALPLAPALSDPARLLPSDDLSELFGLDILVPDEVEAAVAAAPAPAERPEKPKRGRARKTSTTSAAETAPVKPRRKAGAVWDWADVQE